MLGRLVAKVTGSDVILFLIPEWPIGSAIASLIEHLYVRLADTGLTLVVHVHPRSARPVSDLWKAITPAAVINHQSLSAAQEDAARRVVDHRCVRPFTPTRFVCLVLVTTVVLTPTCTHRGSQAGLRMASERFRLVSRLQSPRSVRQVPGSLHAQAFRLPPGEVPRERRPQCQPRTGRRAPWWTRTSPYKRPSWPRAGRAGRGRRARGQLDGGRRVPTGPARRAVTGANGRRHAATRYSHGT
jgi:hypothetical protein